MQVNVVVGEDAGGVLGVTGVGLVRVGLAAVDVPEFFDLIGVFLLVVVRLLDRGVVLQRLFVDFGILILGEVLYLVA